MRKTLTFSTSSSGCSFSFVPSMIAWQTQKQRLSWASPWWGAPTPLHGCPVTSEEPVQVQPCGPQAKGPGTQKQQTDTAPARPGCMRGGQESPGGASRWVLGSGGHQEGGARHTPTRPQAAQTLQKALGDPWSWYWALGHTSWFSHKNQTLKKTPSQWQGQGTRGRSPHC